MITDLVQIRRLGEKKAEENLRFRRHLKTHDYVERRLRRIGEEIQNQIDCTQCGECCRVATTPVAERDIEKLAWFLHLSEAQFTERYTEIDEEGDRILKRTEKGCTFLDGNLCTVYEARPRNCVDFPHVVRGQGPISTRMWQFVDRARYCPIVYNAMEAWKRETGFWR